MACARACSQAQCQKGRTLGQRPQPSRVEFLLFLFSLEGLQKLYYFRIVEDYYDKINKLAERIVSGRAQIGREDFSGWRETLTTAQVGAEIISADRGGVSAAIPICAVEDRSIRRPIEEAVEGWAKSSGLWRSEEEVLKECHL